jgi:hypothetical protein
VAFCAASSAVFAAGMLAPRTSAAPVPALALPVSSTDFSGTWIHESSTLVGRGRGASGGEGPREVKAVIISGAAINCYLECTIVQDTVTIGVTRASMPPNVAPPDSGTVVLNIDGRDTEIGPPNSFGHIAKAKWDGDKLVVTRYAGQISCTQTMSIEDGKLTVTTKFSVSDDVTTDRYAKR